MLLTSLKLEGMLPIPWCQSLRLPNEKCMFNSFSRVVATRTLCATPTSVNEHAKSAPNGCLCNVYIICMHMCTILSFPSGFIPWMVQLQAGNKRKINWKLIYRKKIIFIWKKTSRNYLPCISKSIKHWKEHSEKIPN